MRHRFALSAALAVCLAGATALATGSAPAVAGQSGTPISGEVPDQHLVGKVIRCHPDTVTAAVLAGYPPGENPAPALAHARRVPPDIVAFSIARCDFLGFLHDSLCCGVFCQGSWAGTFRALRHAHGYYRGLGEYTIGRAGSFDFALMIGDEPAPPEPWTHQIWPPDVAGAGEPPRPADYVYPDPMPDAIKMVPPRYPPDARDRGVQGTVLVQALVDCDGAVRATRVLASVPGLDDAALEAVRQWRFTPPTKHGDPVAFWVQVPIRFNLH